jgi:hypothetical protein
VIVEREEQYWKQNGPIRSTEEGIQMDDSDEQPLQALFSMDDSLEPGSNVIVEREEQRVKQDSPNLSTEEGMQIDDSD